MSLALRQLLATGSLAIALGGCAESGGAGAFEPAEEGTLRVATEVVPTAGFWEGTAEQPTGGFEYELAIELQQRFELERLEVETVPFPRIVAGDLGGADLALSLLTPTPERDEALDFSTPYLSAPPALLTSAELDVPDLETARALRYAVGEATTLEAALEQSIDPLEPPLVLAGRDEVLAAVEEGQVDAAIFDLPAAAAFAEASGGELHVAAKLGSDETIAAAVPAGERANAEAIGSAIRALDADGTLDELAQRWLGTGVSGESIPLLRSSR